MTTILSNSGNNNKDEEENGQKSFANKTLEDEDDDENPEISESKRYEKRSTEINFLSSVDFFTSNIAIDLYSGREVLWNVLDFRRFTFKPKEKDSINEMLNTLCTLKKHPFVSQCLEYWFKYFENETFSIYTITENFGIVSLNKFLKSTNSNTSYSSWKSWCLQMALGINYLHSCDPPIVHGCINNNTVFFDSKGVIKLCFIRLNSQSFFNKVSFNQLEKSYQPKPFDYIAQEYRHRNVINTPYDIFDFGLVALQIASSNIEYDNITYTPYKLIDSLPYHSQKNLLRKCLKFFPVDRPTSSELLVHKSLFSFPTLKSLIIEQFHSDEEFIEKYFDSNIDPEEIIITVISTQQTITYKNIPKTIDRELIDSIKYGYESSLVLKKQLKRIHDASLNKLNNNYTSQSNDLKLSNFVNKYEKETRSIEDIKFTVDESSMLLKIEIYFEGTTIRELSTTIMPGEKGIDLAEDLVTNSLIKEDDMNSVSVKLQECLDAIKI